MAGDTLARMEAARERWLTLDDQREVKIRRPHETRLPAGVRLASDLEPCADSVVDWRGFTEAFLLPGQGADKPVPFDRAVWRLVAFDHLDWLTAIGLAAAEDVRAFKQAEIDAAKK